jgi:hypothetical protein
VACVAVGAATAVSGDTRAVSCTGAGPGRLRSCIAPAGTIVATTADTAMVAAAGARATVLPAAAPGRTSASARCGIIASAAHTASQRLPV